MSKEEQEKKQYIDSMNSWIEAAELNIKQIKFNSTFHREEIEMHSKHLQLLNEQLAIESKRLVKVKKDFKKYLKNN